MKKEELFGYEKFEYLPMIRPQTERLLVELIKQHKPKKLLEIGTFLGYSCGVFLETDPNLTVTTLEKEPTNAEYASKNLEKFGTRAKVVCCDAFDFLQNAVKENELAKEKTVYDFIFLDGPKGQYAKYFPLLRSLLSRGGVLVADDIHFHGLVGGDGQVKHKHRSIVQHMRDFLDTIQKDKDFETQIYDFEDGVSVSVKKL